MTANIPIVMIGGTKDTLCSTEDTESLLSDINSTRKDNFATLNHIEGANHHDLLSGADLSHFREHVLPALFNYNLNKAKP